jgi:hypothetical protein
MGLPLGLYVPFGAGPDITKLAPVTGTNVPAGVEWSDRYTAST